MKRKRLDRSVFYTAESKSLEFARQEGAQAMSVQAHDQLADATEAVK